MYWGEKTVPTPRTRARVANMTTASPASDSGCTRVAASRTPMARTPRDMTTEIAFNREDPEPAVFQEPWSNTVRTV